MMLVASLSLGLMNVSVKSISGMHVSEIVFFRAIVQLIIAATILWIQREKPFGNNPKLLIMRGFFGSMGLLCYFYSLQVMPLSNALVIHYLSPILTTLFAFLIGDEQVKKKQWLFFAMSFMGVVIVNGVSAAVTWDGVLAGLGGAIFSALAYNTIRRLKGKENPNVVVLYFPLVTLPISLILPLVGFGDWRAPENNEWIWLILVGVFTQVGQFFMTRSYQEAETQLVSGISYAGIIWGTGFGFFLFNETYSWIQYLGMLLVLLGMYLNIRLNRGLGFRR
ncbi:DMT family transporter [Bacteroidia bacterium]|nr:DMT family transporter [Bacteroidia bacterium]